MADTLFPLTFMGPVEEKGTNGAKLGIYKLDLYPVNEESLARLNDAVFKIRGRAQIKLKDFIVHFDNPEIGTTFIKLPIDTEFLAEFYDLINKHLLSEIKD